MTPDDPQNNDKLMAYFMGKTDERLASIEAKLIELIAFRAEVVASAKATSISVSVGISIAGLVLGVVAKKMGWM